MSISYNYWGISFAETISEGVILFLCSRYKSCGTFNEMKPWKAAEKEVAEYFGGLRRVRIRYDESIGDIIHPKYSIEVKWGKQVPCYLRVIEPTILEVGERRQGTKLMREYYLRPSGYIVRHAWAQRVKRKSAKFLVDAINQALRYDPSKIALVCVKSRGMRGFVICDEIK